MNLAEKMIDQYLEARAPSGSGRGEKPHKTASRWDSFAKSTSTEKLRKILLTKDSSDYSRDALKAIQKELAARGEKI